MNKSLRTQVAAAALLLAPAASLLAPPVLAAPRAPAVEVHTLNLNADSGLAPGSTLRFAVEATPNSKVSVGLGNTPIVVTLKETSAGMYRGSYVVRRADRIDPAATLTARVTRGKTVASHRFSYPASFQQLAQSGGQEQGPRIDRFRVQPVGRLEPGRELHFRLEGAAGAQVSVEIPGVVANVPMRETRPGHYEASYTVRQRDDPDAFTSAVATQRVGRRWVSSRLEQPFVRAGMGAGPASGPLPLVVDSPQHNTSVAPGGPVRVQGQTAPHAAVQVRVEAVTPMSGQRLGVAETVLQQTVQADANGRFSVLVPPRASPVPGGRYEVSLTATRGGQMAQQRLVLQQRFG